jgi:hypothetical protein
MKKILFRDGVFSLVMWIIGLIFILIIWEFWG